MAPQAQPQPQFTRRELGARVRKHLSEGAAPDIIEWLSRQTDDELGEEVLKDMEKDMPNVRSMFRIEQHPLIVEKRPTTPGIEQLQTTSPRQRIDFGQKAAQAGMKSGTIGLGGADTATLQAAAAYPDLKVGGENLLNYLKVGLPTAERPMSIGEQFKKLGLGVVESGFSPDLKPDIDAQKALSTLKANLKSGVTLNLLPSAREDVLNPNINDPRFGALALTGQAVGQLAPTVAMMLAGRVAPGVMPVSRAAVAAPLAVRMGIPAAAAKNLAMVPGAIGAGAGAEFGRQQLMQDAGMQDPNDIHWGGVAGQGLISGALTALPGTVRPLAAMPAPVRIPIAAGAGAGLGAAAGLAQGALLAETDNLSMTDPQVMLPMKFQALVGGIAAALTHMPLPTRSPHLPPARPTYPGAIGDSLTQAIQDIGEQGPKTIGDFRKLWKQVGLPDEVLDAAGLKHIPSSATPAATPLDMPAVVKQLQDTLDALPYVKGQAITGKNGIVTWTPLDMDVARQLPQLYKFMALADGADEIELPGRTIPIDPAARWRFEQWARTVGVESPLTTAPIQGHAQLKAGVDQLTTLLYALPKKSMQIGDFWSIVDNISTPMFRRWLGLGTQLQGKRTVRPDVFEAQLAPYWASADVVTTTPNAQFRDVGFLPTVWWRERYQQQLNAGTPADVLERNFLHKYWLQLPAKFEPWHIRAYRANAMGDPYGWVLGEASATHMPTHLPAAEIGTTLSNKLNNLEKLKAAYNQQATPQLAAQLEQEFKSLYGSQGPRSLKTHPETWRYHTYMRGIMAATENGAPTVYLPWNSESEEAITRIFQDLQAGDPKNSLVQTGVPGIPSSQYAALPVTGEMRASLGVGFKLPTPQILRGGAALAAAAGLSNDDEYEQTGGILAAGMLFPRINPGLLRTLKNNSLLLRTLTGAGVGAAIGAGASSDEEKFRNALVFAITGGVAGAALHGLSIKPDATWAAVKKLRDAYPEIDATLQPNALKNQRWDTFKKAPGESAKQYVAELLGAVKRSVQELSSGQETQFPGFGFITDAELKRMGPVMQPAVDLFGRYRRQQADLSAKTQAAGIGVLDPLETPGELRLFDDYLQMRHRMQTFLNEGQGSIEQPDIMIQAMRESEGKGVFQPVVPEALRKYHDEITALVQKTPNVQAAVNRYDELMTMLAEEQVKRGLLVDADWQRNGPQFPVYKLYKEDPSLVAQIPGAGPYSIAAKDNPKMLQGGMGPSLHGYLEVMPKYIGELFARFQRSDLVDDLEAFYHPDNILNQYGQQAIQDLNYIQLPIPMEKDVLRTVTLPRKVADQLAWEFDGIGRMAEHYPTAFKAFNRATAAAKGWIINMSLGTYYLNNFLGDMVNAAAHAPTRELPQIARGYVDAAFDQFAPSALDPETAAMLAAGKRESLGIGGATAEMSDTMRTDPKVYFLTINPESKAQKAGGGITLAAKHGLKALDAFREGIESPSRKASFLQLMRGEELKDLPVPERVKKAAQMADQRITSYSDTSPAFRAWIKNAIWPLATWYFKNAAMRIPFLARDAATDSRSVQAGKAARVMTKAMIGGLAAAMINEMLTADVEEALPEWMRNQPHINIRTGKDKAVTIAFPFMPGTAVGEMVGLGGFGERAIDVLSGRKDLMDQMEISGDQMKQMWLGLTNPLAMVPAGVAAGTNLRTGQPITDARKPWSEKAWDYFKFIYSSMPPVSTQQRALREASTPDETVGQFLWKATLGSVVRPVPSISEGKAREAHRDYMKAIAEGMEKLAAERYKAMKGSGFIGYYVGASGKPQGVLTQEFAKTLGPLQTMFLYAILRENPGLGKQLGLPDRAAVDSFLGGISDVSNQLAHGEGGQATMPDGSSWDSVWRRIQTAQQHPSLVTYDEIMKAQQKRTKTLFNR